MARAVAAGADPDALSAQGMPMLIWPITRNCPAGFQALLDAGADPDRDFQSAGRTGPIGALLVRQPDLHFLRAALEAGMNPDPADAAEPLLWSAILGGNWPAVQVLIEGGVDPDTPDHRDGWYTPLAFYSSGAFDKAAWLLERGADAGRTATRRRPDGETAEVEHILEDIFYYRIDPERFPALHEAQKRAQAIVTEQGHTRPPRPNRYPTD